MVYWLLLPSLFVIPTEMEGSISGYFCRRGRVRRLRMAEAPGYRYGCRRWRRQQNNLKIQRCKIGNVDNYQWIIGLVILAWVGHGGWWIWQNQKANIKNQNDISKVKDITPATETPIIATQEPTATTPDHAAGLSAKDSSTEDWKTYENKDYGFSFKYPKTVDAPERSIKGSEEWKTYVIEPYETNKKSGSIQWVYIVHESSRPGGFIWGVLVYDANKKNIEGLMKESGDQFDDRKENVEKVVVDGETWTMQTVSTAKFSDWVAKGLYLEKNNSIYYITNGAIGSGNIADSFEGFYKTFKFTN